MIIGNIDLSISNSIELNNSKVLVMDNDKATISLYQENVMLWESKFDKIVGMCFIQYCSTSDENFIFVDESGSSVYMISLKDGDTKSSLELNRKETDDADFYRNSFFTGEGYCLFVYEGGLVKFDVDCNIVWQIKHQYYDWFFKELKDNCIFYESEHDGNWCYSLETGERMA